MERKAIDLYKIVEAMHIRAILLKGVLQLLSIVQCKFPSITVRDINGRQHRFYANSETTTIGQIKQFIYKQCCQSLMTQNMALSYKGQDINNQVQLKTFNLLNQPQGQVFQQRKINLQKLSGLKVRQDMDELLGDRAQVAEMPCKHVISRDSMVQLVRSQIRSNAYSIKCPLMNLELNSICKRQWEFKLCKKVGVFTRQETEQFEDGLNSNWLKAFGKYCPFCKQRVSKGDLQTNKVSCPRCYSSQFCYICLSSGKIWALKFIAEVNHVNFTMID